MIRIMLSCPFQVGEHFQRAEQRLSIQRRQARDRRRQQQVRLRRLRRREERQQRARQQQQQQAEEGSGGPGSVTPDSPFINETLMPSNASIASTVVQPRSNFITDWGERYIYMHDLSAWKSRVLIINDPIDLNLWWIYLLYYGLLLEIIYYLHQKLVLETHHIYFTLHWHSF